MVRGRVVASLVCSVIAAFSGHAAAQSPSVDVPAVYSTTPMTRNADAMLSVSILSTAAADHGLAAVSTSLFRGAHPRGRLARAAKLLLFDVPVVTYFSGLNHEWGHQTSADEFGVGSRLSLVGTPWSSRQFRLETTTPVPDVDLVWPVMHAGGLEASRRLKDRSDARMRRRDRIAPGHALTSIIAALDAPIYAWHDLAPGRFTDTPSGEGDVNTLIFDLAERRFGYDLVRLEELRHDVRTRSTLNLADAALWSELVGLIVDHVWNGETSVRVRWLEVGALQLLPSIRYEWSPFGPEYYVGSHFKLAKGSKTSGMAYVRWSERIGPDRQTGAGASLTLPAFSRTFARRVHQVVPTIELDVWSHTTYGAGLNASIGADVGAWPSERASFTITAGAKSRGQVTGYALDSGVYVTAGVNVRFW
jgi:hypothetical protein